MQVAEGFFMRLSTGKHPQFPPVSLVGFGYLTSRSEYEAAGAGIGAAWRETLGRNFPPSTLLYIAGLVDARAKVEIEVTAFVAAA
jgi:enamine deaminase RidA (YjgF/YER057c/UK114 family)